MVKKTNKTAIRYTSERLVLLQDMILSLLASLLSILLVRWLAEPIPGFTTLVMHWLIAALIGSLLGILISGLARVIRRYLSYSTVSKVLLTILVKEMFMVPLAIFATHLPSTALTVNAIVLDILLTAIALAYPRYAAMVFHREEEEIRDLPYRRNALIMGTGDDSVRLAEQAEQLGRYTVIGFLSTDPSLSGRVIRDKIVFIYSSPKDLESLQWRLGGIDCILFPKDAGRKNPEINLPESVMQADGMGGVEHFIKRAFV